MMVLASKLKETTIVSSKVTPVVKEEAQKILNSVGLTTSTAIQLLFKQLVDLQGLPFSMLLDDNQVKMSKHMVGIPKRKLRTTSVSAQLNQDLYIEAMHCLYQLDMTPSMLIQTFFSKLVYGKDFPLKLDFTEGQRIRLNAMYGIGEHIAPTKEAVAKWFDEL